MRARHCGCQNGSRWERAVETVVLSSKKKEREKQKRINKKRNDGWSISPSGIENWRNQILIECRCAIAFQHFVRFNFVKSERFPRGQELLTVFFSLSLSPIATPFLSTGGQANESKMMQRIPNLYAFYSRDQGRNGGQEKTNTGPQLWYRLEDSCLNVANYFYHLGRYWMRPVG